MKTHALLFLLLLSLSSFAQNPVEINYSQLITGTGDAPPNAAFDVSKLNGADLIINIRKEGNTSANDLTPFKFFLGSEEKSLNQISSPPEYKNGLIQLKITTMATNLSISSDFIIKRGNDKRFSMNLIKPTTTVASTGCPQSDFQIEAEKYFQTQLLPDYKTKGVREVKGMYVDKSDNIHLFVDHFGKYYGHDIPTVATESNSYIIHLITAKCYTSSYSYSYSYTGKYDPKFNIYGGATAVSSAIEIVILNFASTGPFTDKFTFDLSRKATTGDTQPTVISHGDVTIHKRYHVSITTGLLYTSLRNPQNISKMAMTNKTDSTLVADDPIARGLVTVMAVYYPKGRSFLDPPSGSMFDPSRFGIVVGTQLGQHADENFFLGLTHDFATGGAFSYGMHFGRRNIVSGKKDFKYGTDKFDLPQLVVNKEWNIGFYFGVTIDTRVAIQLIKSLAGSATP